MVSSASQRKKSDQAAKSEREVAIIGGGIAGLTCALRLSERNYEVTLYEQDAMLGGQLSSKKSGKDGMYHDVYTHLFCDWYVNFWRIVKDDLKIKREDVFEPRFSVKLLLDPRGSRDSNNGAPKYVELKNPTTAQNVIDNLSSGALPTPDMFLVGFTLLDLVSQPFSSSILQQQSLNGFLYSRPYATEDCADLHNTILNEIWCTSSSDTSAAAYKDFVKHSLGSRGLPFAWLLRGSLEEKLIKPWRDKLEKVCKVEISAPVDKVELADDNKIELTLANGKKATHANIVLAVPAPELANLVMKGRPERTIVHRIPELSELQRMRTANILVVTVVFNERLPDIPREHVGLAASRGYLTFIDISQLWTDLSEKPRTVLVLAASDASHYPAGDDKLWGHLMLQELARYLPSVEPGDEWGDPKSNIDYSKSLAQNNRTHPLFLNDMNSEQLLVEPYYPEQLQNVFFAGDFCRNDVNMATVESAVLSGLHAAHELVKKTDGKSDISVALCDLPSSAQFAAAKLVLLPLAYAALAWSAVNAGVRDLASKDPEESLTPLSMLALIPPRYLADMVVSLENLAVALLSRHEPSGSNWLLQQASGAVARRLLAASDRLRDAAPEGSADTQRTFALMTDVLRAMGTRISEPRVAPAERVSPRTTRMETSGLLRGSGRYRPNFDYARRHRVKP
ncbi:MULTISPECIES: FAD-dependent oxidoreductase [unclassified Bradyrhizobium]|uniref:FAD-dependent oxidoreductase n=1 Tax=unclassified Bradyrhizobium TaxID=2631580 RepID=UPI00247ADFA6|nr:MULTISPECIES: FAD-dependent oxidoreductase [unclassified Bradyrhizobium]WGR70883.1 FAD-dependent oxidoreductase [Bradyrhizobium sp. ISRA426]WGR75722.1 FAD-dependent oxidoreductase [Bradyrhizobium sp. ISRA430]WGR86125.1 FAD-dependent oxidoreductase [Bradyrhizobium sp. ISRA432]